MGFIVGASAVCWMYNVRYYPVGTCMPHTVALSAFAHWTSCVVLHCLFMMLWQQCHIGSWCRPRYKPCATLNSTCRVYLWGEAFNSFHHSH